MTAPDERAALAPCQFCGGKAELRQTRSKVWPMVAVQCTECLALVEAYNDADATAAWERRPPPPPAPAERERLAKALQALAMSARDVNEDSIAGNLFAEAATALRALPASGVEGFVLVPVEPTKAMIKAANRALHEHLAGMTPDIARANGYPRRPYGYDVPGPVKARIRYKAMLAAAPPPGGRADG